MAFDNTITEQEIDVNTQQYLKGLRADGGDYEPDLDVDGMAGGFFARILSMFGVGRS